MIGAIQELNKRTRNRYMVPANLTYITGIKCLTRTQTIVILIAIWTHNINTTSEMTTGNNWPNLFKFCLCYVSKPRLVSIVCYYFFITF